MTFDIGDVEQIRRVIARYARTIDARDIDGVVGCFTADARLELEGGTVCAEGLDAIRSLYAEAFTSPLLAAPASSTHLMGGSEIEHSPDGDVAETLTVAVAYLVTSDGMITRGLTYTDRFRRLDDDWRIAHRVHRCHWQAS